MALKIPKTEFEEYSGNPWTYENPRYETTKASIRAVGVRQRLIVTKRPGEKNYYYDTAANLGCATFGNCTKR